MSIHTSMQVGATLQGAGGGHTDEQPLALFSHFCSYDPLCDAIELPLGTATTPLICAQKSGLSGVRAPFDLCRRFHPRFLGQQWQSKRDVGGV